MNKRELYNLLTSKGYYISTLVKGGTTYVYFNSDYSPAYNLDTTYSLEWLLDDIILDQVYNLQRWAGL